MKKDARNKKYNQKIIAEYDNAQALYHATKDEKKRKKVSRAYFKLKKKKRHHLTFLNEKSWTKLEAKRDSQVPRTVLKIVSPEKIIDLVLQYVGSGCKIPLELLVTKFPVELLEFGFNYCTTLGDDRLLMQMMTLYQERKNDNYGGCSLYLDTFRMVKHMEIPYHELISCKTNDELKTYHDHLVTEYKLAKSEILIKKFEIISNVIVQFDCEIDGFKFEHIATPDEIINESFLMKHCISSYAHSVASGKYMAFRVTGPERATLGIHIINNMPTFDQLKAHCNKQCEEPARRATMKFFEKHNFKLSNVASDLIGNDEDLAIIGGLNGGTILEFKELIKENISLPEEAWLPF